ncbi:MAG: 4-(cytidine 5'-diphospho)-2-C-methyl-D-erythritol kinase [Parvibaculum sp.]|uniref:4-(cytidine 5'-diphospho)-2-C-methyl-D-erythritol kinase n=1 Tax=Parvibaculum sp. TaxID=2024848 RepID=UPI00271CCEE1|nr:4-(cytidine 5'-diphospho)-2-C-methyl-D-erythritol kinase [Parvibaculum sp.]MDO8838712.1 4-(cytidine 5'-diphospho)-2-C-methyl-D-erythritol kinase [Parvibaculum sp.]
MPGAESRQIVEKASAKINLSLRIIGRRADGYHELRSLVVFAQAGDRIVAEAADDLTLETRGSFAAALAGDPDNLVLRAARLLRERTGVTAGARLTLEKNLPVASGIGGGSADAAATLRALTQLWDVDPGRAALTEMAASLGADVPVCLDARPALMWGTGAKLARLAALPHFHLVLVNPGLALPTGDVFRALAAPALETEPAAPDVPVFDSLDDLTSWLAGETNDLQAPATRLAPEIGAAQAALADSKDCRLARMSGSGATCFGIYEQEAAARSAAAAVARAHSGWWVVACGVSDCG